MVKRIISRAVVLAIAFSVVGIFAGSKALGAAKLHAQTEPVEQSVESAFESEDKAPAATVSVSDFDYELSGSICTLIRYKGTAATIVLPKTAVIEGKTYNVTLGTNQDGLFQTTKSAFYESNAKSVSFEKGFAFPVDSSYLFEYCGLDELDLTGVDFSKVENMTSMFSSCFFLVSLRGMDTSHVTNMSYAFDSAHEVDLYGIDTSHVTDVRYMFRSNRADVIDLSSLNFSSVKTCYEMFSHCLATKVYFGATTMSNCTSYKNMFYESSNLETVEFSKVTVNMSKDDDHLVNMQDMFYKCTKLEKVDMSGFSCYADVQYMCYDCDSLEYLDFSSMYAFGANSSGIYDRDTLRFFRPFARSDRSYSLALAMVAPDGTLWKELPDGLCPVKELVAGKITKQPVGVMAVENTEVTFAIETNISDKETDVNAYYRWQYSTDDGETWTNFQAGGKTCTFTAEMSMDNYAFRCLVFYTGKYNPGGDKADLISKTVWLLVWEESATIEKHPVSRSGYYGDEVSFQVQASGNLLKYCWQESTNNGKTWKNSSFSGADTYTLRLSCTPSVDGRLFRCIVSSGNLKKYTDIVKLDSRSLISGEPTNQTVDSGAYAVFSVTCGAPGVTYQWMYSNDGGKTWSNTAAAGNTTNTLRVLASTSNNRFQYRCSVINGAYCQYSKAATLILQGVTPTPTPMTSKTIEVGESFTYKVSGVSASNIKWSMGNTSVATVDASGKVTGKSVGNTYLHVGLPSGKEIKCLIKVVKPELAIRYSEKTLHINQTFTFTVSGTWGQAVTWSVGNTSVASVGAATGKVTGKSAGNTWLYAKTADGRSAKCLLKVIDPGTLGINYTEKTVYLGQSFMFAAKNAGILSVTWSVGNTAVAKVDSNGKVTPVSVGNTYLYAKTADGRSAKCLIKVVDPGPLNITYTEKTIKVGATFHFAAKNPAGQTVTWKVGNTAVATVDENGIVTGKSVGNTWLYASTPDGREVKCLLRIVT